MPYDSYGRTLEEIIAREQQTRQGMSEQEAAAREQAILNQLQQGNTDLAWDMSGGPYRSNGGTGETLSSQESWSRTPMGPNGAPMGPMPDPGFPTMMGMAGAQMGPMTQAQAQQQQQGFPTMMGGAQGAPQPSSSGPVVGPSAAPRPPSLAGPPPPMGGPSMGAPMAQGPRQDTGFGIPSMAPPQAPQQAPQERGWYEQLTDPRMPDGSMPNGNQMAADALGSIWNSITNPRMPDGSMPNGNQMILDALGMGKAPQKPGAMSNSGYPYSSNYQAPQQPPWLTSSPATATVQPYAAGGQAQNWNYLLDMFKYLVNASQGK